MKSINPKKLYWKAWRMNYLWHPFRNNPRNTNTIYYGFKCCCVGLDNWNDLNADLRNSWDSSRFSFDKLYGQLKVYKNLDLEKLIAKEKETKGQLEKLIAKEKETKGQDEIESFEKSLEKIMSMLVIFKKYDKKIKSYEDEYRLLAAALDKVNDVTFKREILDYLKQKSEKYKMKQQENKNNV